MKVSELTKLMEQIVSDEIRKTILNESEGKNVYHIKCEGIPLATFNSEQEAMEALPKYKSKHKGELIIEKGNYNSHEDMINKLDEMNDQLEETDNMENTQMDEKLVGKQGKLDKNHNGKIDGQDFKIMQGQQDEEEECYECGQSMEEEKSVCSKCGKEVCECWDMKEEVSEEELEEMLRGNQKKIDANHNGKVDAQDFKILRKEKDMNEEKKMCSECGGMMNEEGMCNECGGMMYESKKKMIKLKESELVSLIKKMVTESMKADSKTSNVPGVVNTNRAQKGSKKENDDAMAAVDKKMKDYLNFDGNDNSEFPHQNGMATKKAAIVNTKEQDEETNKNFAGLQNLDYDLEPSEQFKKRMKMSLEGSALMGNAPSTEAPKIKPSNGADKGKPAKEKQGNHIPTPETAKNFETQMKDREKDKKNRVLYPKETVPVNESKVSFSSVLTEEIQKMKNLTAYNKKTQ